MLKLLLSPLILTCCLVYYQQKPLPEWLVGVWVNSNNVHEEWVKEREELLGRSYKVIGGDTAVSETIRVYWKDEVMVYIPTVTNQNDGKPIEFRMTTNTQQLIEFENLNHDFPQKIRYRLVTKDSLVATISGVRGVELISVEFPMKRVNY